MLTLGYHRAFRRATFFNAPSGSAKRGGRAEKTHHHPIRREGIGWATQESQEKRTAVSVASERNPCRERCGRQVRDGKRSNIHVAEGWLVLDLDEFKRASLYVTTLDEQNESVQYRALIDFNRIRANLLARENVATDLRRRNYQVAALGKS